MLSELLETLISRYCNYCCYLIRAYQDTIKTLESSATRYFLF